MIRVLSTIQTVFLLFMCLCGCGRKGGKADTSRVSEPLIANKRSRLASFSLPFFFLRSAFPQQQRKRMKRKENPIRWKSSVEEES